MSSSEYRAFTKATADLNTALAASSCVEWFADKLADEGLIADNLRQDIHHTFGVNNYQRASKITNSLISRIRINPGDFHKVIAILSQERALGYIVEKLQGGRPASTPASTLTVRTIDDYLHGYNEEGLREALEKETTELDRAKISLSIGDWRELLPYLDLSCVDESTILADNPHNVTVQRQKMLSIWHSRRGRRHGTYKHLVGCFIAAQRIDLADKVVEVLGYTVPSRTETSAMTSPLETPVHSTPSPLEVTPTSLEESTTSPLEDTPTSTSPLEESTTSPLEGIPTSTSPLEESTTPSVEGTTDATSPLEGIPNTTPPQEDSIDNMEGLRRRADTGRQSQSQTAKEATRSTFTGTKSRPPSNKCLCFMLPVGLAVLVILVMARYVMPLADQQGVTKCSRISSLEALLDDLIDTDVDWKILAHELSLGNAFLHEVEGEKLEENRRTLVTEWWKRRTQQDRCWEAIEEALQKAKQPLLAEEIGSNSRSKPFL